MKTSWITLFICSTISAASGREPFKPAPKSVPYIVYFASRYRGMCVGTLISKNVVMTAAVCVTNPEGKVPDKRPLNVVAGSPYRHPRRGVRVQVTKVLIPRLPSERAHREYYIQKAPAVLLLKRKIPDVLVEVPLRAIEVDYRGEMRLALQQECFVPGWHFFYKGDTVYPVYKFLLQRNMRAQFVNIVSRFRWCETLTMKFQRALDTMGFDGNFDAGNYLCIRDTENSAQPCHGNYGAPLVCRGRVVALMLAPDAQWSNCTGYSFIMHLLDSKHLANFFNCLHTLFEPELRVDWEGMKREMYDQDEALYYDYISEMYDKMYEGEASE